MKTFHPIRGKSVYIIFQSKGLGDTLAWFPYVEQFRVENKCNVKVFLPRQEMIPLLKPNYPDIEFLLEEKYIQHFDKDGLCFKLPMSADGIISYKIGTTWDGRQYIPLQQSATEILGLPFIERKPNLVFKNYGRPIKEKYVCIGVHSNGPQLKYWNYPNGWNYVVKYLKHKGYEVLDIDLHEEYPTPEMDSSKYRINTVPDGVIKKQNKPLEVTINNIVHSEFFIGVSSGLSWLSWALNKWTIMISGFTEPWFEFQHKCIHIHNSEVCNGCWHRDETLNLKGDWNVCPDYKGTEREFECSKEIDPPMVFSAIDKIIDDIRDKKRV
jgi:autotransporter strand-loop-strand O-heptosyltransferase